ncbi:MAG: hypothetical protein J1E83_12510 [Lachnospiraceae bacterium]|nr:hypothetical protein [Lachnospiraceae bacterium]
MLFLKECKKVLFSLTFVIYCITALAMYFTQFHGDIGAPLEAPAPGRDDYGMTAKEIPELLMPEAVWSLITEYYSGSFTAYPYGFIKHVKLTEKQKARMEEIILEVSGLTMQELEAHEYFKIPEDLTYEHFRELMREADKIIGGGSKYGDNFIVGNFSYVPKTYEDALLEYEQFLYEDKITGAYARLYCDYLGIIVSVLPVFVAAALANRDKKSRMEQLIFARKISSVKLIFTRFFSLTAIMLTPVVITAVIAQIKVNSIYPNGTMDSFALFKYAAFWLVPNIMAASAVGMLITEIASGLLAIFIQGVWWITSISAATSGLTGRIGKFTLIMRHNSLMGYDAFFDRWENIVFNRIFFTVVSILGIALTAFIYEQKRKGVFNVLFKINFQNSKRQSKA